MRVAKLLAHQLYTIGDKLLEDGTPIALTINDLHCITKRLRLPMDTHPSELSWQRMCICNTVDLY